MCDVPSIAVFYSESIECCYYYYIHITNHIPVLGTEVEELAFVLVLE